MRIPGVVTVPILIPPAKSRGSHEPSEKTGKGPRTPYFNSLEFGPGKPLWASASSPVTCEVEAGLRSLG